MGIIYYNSGGIQEIATQNVSGFYLTPAQLTWLLLQQHLG